MNLEKNMIWKDACNPVFIAAQCTIAKTQKQPWGFPGGSVVKNLPAKQETWVQSLGWEDPLEKEMVTHSSILAWRMPWTEESGGHKQLDMT